MKTLNLSLLEFSDVDFTSPLTRMFIVRLIVESIERAYNNDNGLSPKIEAIKQLRKFTGLGLKESKDIIESYIALDWNPESCIPDEND